ncbi:MAG: ribose-phosphate diphosphokinase, partial [Actinobacteria bacterium]
MMLFSGSANVPLAEEVGEVLGLALGQLELSKFANGELYARPVESVRGADCYVIQSHSDPVNDHIMEQLVTIDALRRASARRITAVMPFYGYSRQDKKVLPREPITARLVGDLFMTAGADRLVSVDLHTGQLQGFIQKPFDHLTAIPMIADYVADQIDG